MIDLTYRPRLHDLAALVPSNPTLLGFGAEFERTSSPATFSSRTEYKIDFLSG